MPDLPTPSYPGRSLESVTIGFNETGDLILSCFCDCGETTDVLLEGALTPAGPPTTDFSYTCAGCLSVHWMAVVPVEQVAHG